jgi:hypothetical protein
MEVANGSNRFVGLVRVDRVQLVDNGRFLDKHQEIGLSPRPLERDDPGNNTGVNEGPTKVTMHI